MINTKNNNKKQTKKQQQKTTTVKPAYCDHLWARYKWQCGLFREVKIVRTGAADHISIKATPPCPNSTCSNYFDLGLFREVKIVGTGAVGTWWSGLNRQVVSFLLHYLVLILHLNAFGLSHMLLLFSHFRLLRNILQKEFTRFRFQPHCLLLDL